MNGNKQFIIDSFNKNFRQHKDKNIFLYGTNANTDFILNHFTDYNFIGLLDGMKKNEYMYGKYIYDIEDIPNLNPDMIIIVARATTVRVITRRIRNFCIDNNIQLFDIAGHDLLISESFKNDDPYFNINAETLKKQIESHESISFDIFDTLIMRRVLFPKDVFDIADENINIPNFDFKTERIKAEQELLRYTNPDIDEIYDRLKQNCSLTADKINYMKSVEMGIEQKVLIPRKEMVDMLNYGVSLNKKVYLISDMYFNKKILTEFLERLNITGYDDIFVSCEYKMSKSEGLFSKYKSKVSADSYLHIGDNEFADGQCANSEGIDSFIIKSAYDLLYISSYSEILCDDNNFNSRLYTGIFISEIFNNPFILYNSDGKFSLENNRNTGFYLAPLAAEFIQWFADRILKDKCENILFAARDGYLIQKLYEIVSEKTELPHSEYLLTSRMACISSGIEDEQDIVYASGLDFSGSPEELMEKRFCVDKQNIKKYDSEMSVADYAVSHAEEIYKSSEACRENYLRYINGLNIDFNKKTAFFDFASSGTCQMCLEKILNTKLYGYYFLKIYDDYERKQQLTIKSMQEPALSFEIQSNLYNKYAFIETILTSDKPSVKMFDNDGEPVYTDEYRTQNDINAISEIHKCIIDYFKIFYDLNSEKNYTYNPVPDKIFGLLDESKTFLNSDYLQKSVFKDEYCVRNYDIKSMV